MLSVRAHQFWMDNPPAVEPLRLRRVPMLAATLCFATGELLARRSHSPLLLLISILLLFSLTLLSLRKAARIAVIPAMGLWIALGCWCAQMQRPIDTQHALTNYADGLSRNVRGRVIRIRNLDTPSENPDAPQQFTESEILAMNSVLSVDLEVQAVEDVAPDLSVMRPVNGGVRITVLGNPSPLRCGDVLEVPLQMHTPEIYRDPGAWSYRDQLLEDGIGVLAVTRPYRISVVGHRFSTLRCHFFAVQTWASRKLQQFTTSTANTHLPYILSLHGDDTTLLDAMLFGDRSTLRHSLRIGFERTGTFHLFVVSGLHIAFFTGACFWILRRLRAPDGVAVLTSIAAASGFAMLSGFGVPAQRALFMSAIYLLARWLSREISTLNALGIAALAVLVMDPRALFEASFQMTFLVILAIAGLALPLLERYLQPWKRTLHRLEVVRIDAALHPRFAQFRVRLRMACHLCEAFLPSRLKQLPVWILHGTIFFLELALVGLATEACMVLPMAVYFHRAALLALPINLLIVPFVGILFACAAATFCASLITPWLAILPGTCTALVLHGLLAAIDRAQLLPFADLRTPAPPNTVIAAVCLAVLFACWALRQRQRRWLAAGIATAALIPLATLWPAPPLLYPNALEVTAIDVGQGDSLFVASPNGHTMLVDAGGPVGRSLTQLEDQWDVGEEVVAPYLWSRRLRRLDVVVLTHAHSDHMGGMYAILQDFHPRELWLSVQPGRSPGLRRLLAEAHALHISIRWFRAGDTFSWEGLNTKVLAPEAGYNNPGPAVNNDSLVLRLAYGKSSVLLEGDAEKPSETAMLEHNRIQSSTLLKVGHHGSKTSTTEKFLAAVHPRDAVISVGARNTFGHPRGEVLQSLETAHVKTFRTDRQGAETFLLHADGTIAAQSASTN